MTLIELMLVIAIIAVLGTLGLGVMAGAEERALENATRAQLDRLSRVLNTTLENNTYRILPVRLTGTPDPATVRAFRQSLLNEVVRVEFPWQQAHNDPSTYPQDGGLTALGVDVTTGYYPQIAQRYWAKINQMFVPPPPPTMQPTWWDVPVPFPDADGNGVIDNIDNEVYWRTVSAECLYVILSLSTNQYGEPLVAMLRANEIGDTNGNGVPEVLDAFGDPVRFALLALPDEETLSQLRPPSDPDPEYTESLRPEFSRQFGYEVILDGSPLVAGQQIGRIRGPRPIHEYRFIVQSVHLGISPILGEIVEQY